MAKQFFKRFLIFLFGLTALLYRRLRDSVSRLWSQYRAPSREEAGRLPQKQSWTRAAIVSARSDSQTLPFLINLLNGLVENDFFVLLVTPPNPPSVLKAALLAHCHQMVQKFSIGQESAFKAGWDWVSHCGELSSIDTLLFANDSYYYPRYIGSTIPQMLKQECGWLNLFEGSSFQLFFPPVFTANEFRDYWQNLTFGAARLRAVASKDKGVAGALRNATFMPQTYYNAVRLHADVMAALENENIPERLQDVLNLTLGYARRKSNDRAPRRKDALSYPAAGIADKIAVLAEKNDPALTIGLLSNYLYQAPVRRDIARHFNADDIIDLAQGFSTDEKEAMAKDLRRKSVSNLATIQKIPQRLRIAGRSV